MKIGLPIVVAFLFFLSACGPNQSDFNSLRRNLEDLKQENQGLRDKEQLLTQENERLKADIENYYMGPQRLLSRAQNYLKDRQYADAKETLALLVKKHPFSCEALLSKNLLEQANQMMLADKSTAGKEKKLRSDVTKQNDLTAAIATMRMAVDAATGTTWYEDKDMPQSQNLCKIILGISMQNSKAPVLHLTVNYAGKKWLDIGSFTVYADNQKFDSSLVKFERGGIGNGFIWEYIDMSVGSIELEWIRAVIASQKAVIQYHGEQFDGNREIPLIQKKALQNVLDAFVALGGSLPK